ncbi:unannotated protein [freshwater metagenome]|uniref:Unannotated protein n=1 Tax=freshwater metagenome TaxID=449393 RepID=A0A6J7JBI3_9ZZZZ|nr:hypothetical protein [Actinomycetota bacterium]
MLRRGRRGGRPARRFGSAIAVASFVVLVIAIPMLLGFAISWLAGVVAAVPMVMLWDWALGR